MYVSRHHLLKGLFIPLNGLGTVVEYQFSKDVRVYFWILNSSFHWSLCPPPPFFGASITVLITIAL